MGARLDLKPRLGPLSFAVPSTQAQTVNAGKRAALQALYAALDWPHCLTRPKKLKRPPKKCLKPNQMIRDNRAGVE